ncbi:hypothetical protein GCM10009592_28520 [Brachybacterium rhamnosum]|uniref:Uncharacterized protein n=1 Tax=Brachybacterium rhamnosum TaxID=173361 RepID=A0ABW4Q1J0_9MICO
MTTIGELTLNDIDSTTISIEWRGDTITGVIRDIQTSTWQVKSTLGLGIPGVRVGDRVTDVKIHFSNFVVDKIRLDHPCEVIS